MSALKQHILLELKQFIHSITKGNKNLTSNSLIRTSLHLLEDLPAAREVIFEYFGLVAEILVKEYAVSMDTQCDMPIKSPTNVSTDSSNFLIIQEALENLINKGPSVWGPVIAKWCLDNVGSLSNKYMIRAMPIAAACNFWIHCPAMRGLMTLISLCFRKLTNAEAEVCVESLLDTFQRYSVSFDWVVGRLGGCFPLKIISQIMQFSLKRFSDDYRCRLDSEINILDYLCFAHEQELKVALREMLQDGFKPQKSLDASIIPFLIVISNYSDLLLENLISVFLELYNKDLLATIVQKSPLWMSNNLFAEMQPSFNNMTLRLKNNGTKLILTVAQMGEEYSWCHDFLEYTLLELEQVTLNARICPLINDASTEESKCLLWKSCSSSNLYEQQTAVRLLLIVSVQHFHIYYQTISELLRKCYITNQTGIGALIRIIGGQSGVVDFPDIKPGLKMVLEDVLLQEQFQRTRLALPETPHGALNTYKNLNTLTTLFKKHTFTYVKPHVLVNALIDCLPKIMQILDITLVKLLLNMDEKLGNCKPCLLNKVVISHQRKRLSIDPELSNENDKTTNDYLEQEDPNYQRLILTHTVIDLLNAIEAGSKSHMMRTTEVMKLAVLSVKYFFICLTESTTLKRATCVNRAVNLIRRQCQSRKIARNVCLRELVEGAMFSYGYLFGQKREPEVDELEISENEMVLAQNLRQGQGPNSNRTNLHAGVIGRGLRPANTSSADGCSAEIETHLIRALDACCADTDKQIVIESYSMISLLLVELVSTDVMYNGLPFPEEEFTKVTMERDLLIKRAFVSLPIIWTFLTFVATHRPALCFSSVLLRALCATCLHQWKAKNVNKFQASYENDELMQSTKKLLEILSLGQLLTPPLSHLHLIMDYFDPPEITLILRECVWNYLKDHVPSPALFHIDNNNLHWRNWNLGKMPPQYVELLRNLMQKKLHVLGHHYHQMFIMGELIDKKNKLAIMETDIPELPTVPIE